MARRLLPTLLALLALRAGPARAEGALAVTPSVGMAWIANLPGYEPAPLFRVDVGWFPIPEIGLGAFGVAYGGFRAGGGGSRVTVDLKGAGASLTGAWRAHPVLLPYLRLDYLLFSARASGFGRTLSSADGDGFGLAAGVRLATASQRVDIRLEVSATQRLSGADVRQVSLGAALAF